MPLIPFLVREGKNMKQLLTVARRFEEIYSYQNHEHEDTEIISETHHVCKRHPVNFLVRDIHHKQMQILIGLREVFFQELSFNERELSQIMKVILYNCYA